MTVMFIMTGIFWKCVFLLYEDQYIKRIYCSPQRNTQVYVFFNCWFSYIKYIALTLLFSKRIDIKSFMILHYPLFVTFPINFCGTNSFKTVQYKNFNLICSLRIRESLYPGKRRLYSRETGNIPGRLDVNTTP